MAEPANDCPACGTEGGHKPSFEGRVLVLSCRTCGAEVRRFEPLPVTEPLADPEE